MTYALTRLFDRFFSIVPQLRSKGKYLTVIARKNKQNESGRVYDCFTFFNELDLLEMRLNILNDVVDYFVIVEANQTHTGKPKEFIFELNRSRYSAFESKIIYIKVEDLPMLDGVEHDEFGRPSAWIRERFQRNSIERAFLELDGNEIVMISDLDEIPRPSAVLKHKGISGVKIFEQRFYSCYLNLQNSTTPFWLNGTRMTTVSELRNIGASSVNMDWVPESSLGRPQALRFWRPNDRAEVVPDAGWHFSSLGDVDRILQKMDAFSHQELINSDINTRDKLEQRLSAGNDIFGRDVEYDLVEMDGTYPKYILDNVHRYSNLIKSV